MFQQLVEYKQKHGDCLVPSRFVENVKLGKWVETQRYEYTKMKRVAAAGEDTSDTSAVTLLATKANNIKARRLTQERQERLESIGFEWKVKNKMKRYHDHQWNASFDRLVAFHSEHGHFNVPQGYSPDMKLRQWIASQRMQYRKLTAVATKVVKHKKPAPSSSSEEEESKGEKESTFNGLTEERRKKLEAVGFPWESEKDEAANAKDTRRSSYDVQVRENRVLPKRVCSLGGLS